MGGGTHTHTHTLVPPVSPPRPLTSGQTPCAWFSVRICLVTTTNTEVPWGEGDRGGSPPPHSVLGGHGGLFGARLPAERRCLVSLMGLRAWHEGTDPKPPLGVPLPAGG